MGSRSSIYCVVWARAALVARIEFMLSLHTCATEQLVAYRLREQIDSMSHIYSGCWQRTVNWTNMYLYCFESMPTDVSRVFRIFSAGFVARVYFGPHCMLCEEQTSGRNTVWLPSDDHTSCGPIFFISFEYSFQSAVINKYIIEMNWYGCRRFPIPHTTIRFYLGQIQTKAVNKKNRKILRVLIDIYRHISNIVYVFFGCRTILVAGHVIDVCFDLSSAAATALRHGKIESPIFVFGVFWNGKRTGSNNNDEKFHFRTSPTECAG